MELEDLGPPTFAAQVVKYRGQLLELTRTHSTLSDLEPKSKVAREVGHGDSSFKLATRSPRWHGRLADRCGAAPLTSGKLVATYYLSC